VKDPRPLVVKDKAQKLTRITGTRFIPRNWSFHLTHLPVSGDHFPNIRTPCGRRYLCFWLFYTPEGISGLTVYSVLGDTL